MDCRVVIDECEDVVPMIKSRHSQTIAYLLLAPSYCFFFFQARKSELSLIHESISKRLPTLLGNPS